MDDLRFAKLDLHAGDVILVRTHASAHEQEALAEAFTKHAAIRGLHDVTLITLREGESIRELDEHLMLMHGWMRIVDER